MVEGVLWYQQSKAKRISGQWTSLFEASCFWSIFILVLSARSAMRVRSRGGRLCGS